MLLSCLELSLNQGQPTALGPGANTDTKLLIYGLFQKGRVLAQDGVYFFVGATYGFTCVTAR